MTEASQKGLDGAGAPTSTEAAQLKDQGNELFKAGNFLKAAALYTQAIKLDPENAALYSNRSAALLNLSKVSKALADAETSIKLRPTWEKGYFRKGCALEALKKYEEALAAFKEAADHNPKSFDVGQKIKGVTRLLRDQRRAEGRTKDKDTAIRNDEDYEKAKQAMSQGASIPFSEERVAQFGKDTLEAAANAWVESGGKLEPSVYFLPGKLDADGEKKIAQVSINKAFESPDTVSNCAGFLRQYAIDTSAHAACLVVTRSTIAFPQRWKGLGEKGWKFGEKEGYFVQLESVKQRSLWFVPAPDRGKVVPGPATLLDADTYGLLPQLFQ